MTNIQLLPIGEKYLAVVGIPEEGFLMKPWIPSDGDMLFWKIQGMESGEINLPAGSWSILGRLNEISEEQLIDFCGLNSEWEIYGSASGETGFVHDFPKSGDLSVVFRKKGQGEFKYCKVPNDNPLILQKEL